MKIELAEGFILRFPQKPGVYRYYNNKDELLYVGKAINLQKRIKSYFGKTLATSPRISLMVAQINYIEITIVDDETSALLLESNLIKSLKPKYNVIFRDDKSYPFIKISQHNYPLVEYFRGKPNIKAKYYGPYPNSYAVRQALETIQKIFKLRTCTDVTFANRSRPCLLHQIDLCSAPCVNKITQTDYAQTVKQARDFLEGNYADLIKILTDEMYQNAEKFDFEKAGQIRDKIGIIKQIQSNQIISSANSPLNADIILAKERADNIFIYLIIVRNGLYIGDEHFIVHNQDDLTNAVEAFLSKHYLKKSEHSLIYLNLPLSEEFISYFAKALKLKIISDIPLKIKELMQLGETNLHNIIENYRQDNIYIQGKVQLAELLEIVQILRIECYDVSHNHGSNAVASMVVFENDKIDNSKYRRYNLSEAINGDDLLAMQTVFKRRFANKELPLPEVILVDGGYNQLKAAKNVLDELGLYDKIKLVAIYKGDKRKPELDTIIIAETREIGYEHHSAIFKVLQSLRDEAHRFAITGHRKRQTIKLQSSKLEDIPGIGAKKRKALLGYFGSMNAVSKASITQLQQVEGIGLEIAKIIYNHFN